MPLVVNGSAARRARVESWLREICWSVTVDPDTGAVSHVLGPPGPGQPTSGCACITALMEGSRTVTIHPVAGPDVPIPGAGGMTVGDAGGGATVYPGAGLEREDGSAGPGTNTSVYIDDSNNDGDGYRHGSPMWLVLAHELTSGHAYHASRGTGARTAAGRERQAIASENEHRQEHDMDPRPLPEESEPEPEPEPGPEPPPDNGGDDGRDGNGGTW